MKNLRLFSACAAMALTWGCANPPESCYQPSLTVAEKGEIIIFDNCSLFADEANWEFGDGNTSTEYDPRYAYSATGEFVATLTATKGGKNPDATSEIILVGERMLNYVDVIDLPDNNAQGNPWDGVGDPADPQLFFKRSSSSTWELSSTINTNMNLSLPFIYNLGSNFFSFTYEPWDFMLLDDDGGGAADTMGLWTVDLDTVFPTRFIPLSGTNFDLKVRYVLQ